MARLDWPGAQNYPPFAEHRIWILRPTRRRRSLPTVGNEWSADDERGEAMSVSLPVIAGAISTVLFTLSMLPMLVKAARTKDLSSYSLGSIALSNLGNAIHSVYVFHLPLGPIWVLHSFYLVSTALMLAWYVRYAAARERLAPATSASTQTSTGGR